VVKPKHSNRTERALRSTGFIGLALLLVLLLLLYNVAVAAADDDDFADEIVAGELIVRMQPGVSPNILAPEYGTVVLDQLSGLDIYRLKLPTGADEYDYWSDIKGETGVRYADFNYVEQAPEGRPYVFVAGNGAGYRNSNPTLYTRQYAYNLIGTPQAHNFTTGAGSIVAVLDTGINPNHQLFANRLTSTRYDFVSNDGSPDDLPNGLDDDSDGLMDEATGHGSHVAGTVLLAAPEAQIMVLRVLDSDGRGDLFSIQKAIKYATDNGAHIINLSLGTYGQTEVASDLVNYAWERNVLIVAAAGNDGSDQQDKWQFPAAFDRVVAVAATNHNDRKADFSNYAQYVDISAPGTKIYSANWDGGYLNWNGTSMATPFVAGGAALIKSRFPSLTPAQITARLKNSATPIDYLNPQYQGKLGTGRLNLPASLS
jgi:subtilisin family serine protease